MFQILAEVHVVGGKPVTVEAFRALMLAVLPVILIAGAIYWGLNRGNKK